MEENKLSSYLAWTAFFITGIFTLFHFLSGETLINLVLMVLFRATLAYFLFKYLGLGIERLLRWKVPQLYDPNAVRGREGIDFVMPAETPNKNDLRIKDFMKEEKRKESS